jgi:DNA-binding beta-propeller fold protein YncE
MRLRPVLIVGVLFAVVGDAAADTLIVGNKTENTVSFIDLEIGAEVARRDTGPAPHEIAVSPDGRRAVVVSYRGSGYLGETLYVFDVERAEKIAVIDLAGHTAPHGLKWIVGTSRVIATTEATNDVVIVDVDAGSVVGAIKTGGAGTHMIALSPDAKRAYAASINSGVFAVIDIAALKTLRTVKAGSGTEAISATPDGREIWVGANTSRKVLIFDASTFEKKAEIKTEGVPIRVELSPDGAVAAISEFDRNRVSIYDTTTRTLTATVDLAGAKAPVTLLFSPDGARLWAAATGSAMVTEIETSSWKVGRTLNAGKGSDGLGFSPLDVAVD